MIKLIQEERDMGTKEVQEVMQQVDVEIVSVIQSYLKIAIEKGEISKCDPKLQHLLCCVYMYRLFLIGKKSRTARKRKIAELFELYLLKGLSN